jgi:amicyanin
MRRSMFTGVIVAAFLGIVVAAQSKPAATEIKIDNFTFGPRELKVPVGATVTWTNRDDIPHTVVSDERVFKSRVLDTDETFSVTFVKAGTYPYFCSIHPKMTGKVVVEPIGASNRGARDLAASRP